MGKPRGVGVISREASEAAEAAVGVAAEAAGTVIETADIARTQAEKLVEKQLWGHFQCGTLFQLKGSVWPFAFGIALPPSLLSALLKYNSLGEVGGPHGTDWNFLSNTAPWTGFTMLVSFTIVFRTSQAYTRFWNALDDAHVMLTMWYNAASSLVAFARLCDDDEQSDHFCNLSVRLFSLLSACALEELSDVGEHHIWGLETLDASGVDDQSISTLDRSRFRVVLCFQWIQQHITDSIKNGTLKIPPPILGGAYRELQHGMTKFHDATKHSKVPFPFPYAQVTLGLLIMHWIICPLVMVQWTNWVLSSCAFTFVQIFTLWCLNSIAMGFEKPFGGHLRDMKPHLMQNTFNDWLLVLIAEDTVATPSLQASVDKSRLHHRDTLHSIALRHEGWAVAETFDSSEMSSAQRCQNYAHRFCCCGTRHQYNVSVAMNQNFSQKRYAVVDGERTAVFVVGIFNNDLVLALPYAGHSHAPGLVVEVPNGLDSEQKVALHLKRVPVSQRYQLQKSRLRTFLYNDFPSGVHLRPDVLAKAYQRAGMAADQSALNDDYPDEDRSERSLPEGASTALASRLTSSPDSESLAAMSVCVDVGAETLGVSCVLDGGEVVDAHRGSVDNKSHPRALSAVTSHNTFRLERTLRTPHHELPRLLALTAVPAAVAEDEEEMLPVRDRPCVLPHEAHRLDTASNRQTSGP